MKSIKVFLWIFAGLFCLSLISCQNEKKDNDFSGVSNLIADRNRARYDAAERRAAQEKKYTSKQKTSQELKSVKPESKKTKKDISTIMLYRKNVKILDSKSGRPMAKGVAYLNKNGEIIKIKILKN